MLATEAGDEDGDEDGTMFSSKYLQVNSKVDDINPLSCLPTERMHN